VQTASLTRQANAQVIQADASAKKDAEESARKAAAKSAIQKKEATEKAEQEAKKRAEAKTAASRDASGFPVQSTYTVAQIQAMAAQMVPSGPWTCFNTIVHRVRQPVPGVGLLAGNHWY
jgi:septal ring factor EnvC (AmiA/AmiB activator)